MTWIPWDGVLLGRKRHEVGTPGTGCPDLESLALTGSKGPHTKATHCVVLFTCGVEIGQRHRDRK